MLAVLSPTTRALGPVFLDQLRGAVMGAPLPFGESLLIAWPQTVGADCRYDRAVRRRLCRVPAPGGEGLSAGIRWASGSRPGNKRVRYAIKFTSIDGVPAWFLSTAFA